MWEDIKELYKEDKIWFFYSLFVGTLVGIIMYFLCMFIIS